MDSVAELVGRVLAALTDAARTTQAQRGHIPLHDRGRVEVAVQATQVLHYLAAQGDAVTNSSIGQAGAFGVLARLLDAAAAARVASSTAARSSPAASSGGGEQRADRRQQPAGANPDGEVEEPGQDGHQNGRANVGGNQNEAEGSERGEEEEESTMDGESEDEEEESDDLASALNGLQAQAANTIWCLCIAHPSNKERAIEAIPALVRLIKSETRVDILRGAASALWSVCYGVVANQQKVLAEGAAPHLVALLGNTSSGVRRSATGAIWHLSSLPEARRPIVEAGGLSALVSLLQACALELESENRDEQQLNACLALANLSMTENISDEMERTGALQQIRLFVEAHDCRRYAMHNLVWTTLKPLIDLLETKHEEVNELGCFLIACLSRSNQQTAKLFHEGAVSTLERLATREDQPTVRQLACIALGNLGISVNSNRASKTAPTDNEDIDSLLRALKLDRYIEVFKKNEITHDNIIFLEEADLVRMGVDALGPKRHLMAYIDARKRVSANVSHKPPSSCISQSLASTLSSSSESTDTSSTLYPCLICCDAERSVCFVPCGHVVSCKDCSRILVARGDVCIICRSPINHTVIPFFV